MRISQTSLKTHLISLICNHFIKMPRKDLMKMKHSKRPLKKMLSNFSLETKSASLGGKCFVIYLEKSSISSMTDSTSNLKKSVRVFIIQCSEILLIHCLNPKLQLKIKELFVSLLEKRRHLLL